MSSYKRILVAVDLTDEANIVVDKAREVAKLYAVHSFPTRRSSDHRKSVV